MASAEQNDYPSSGELKIIRKVEALMEETMKKYDPSHDALHVNRVRKTALVIARTMEPLPDLLVVELAALMHDMLDKKYVSAEEAADPYGYFLPLFQKIQSSLGSDLDAIDVIADGRLRLIAKVTENVSWTTEKKLRASGGWTEWHETCMELHCVQDADRLDAIGAFGIMRCAAFSAVSNRPLYIAPDEPHGTQVFEGSAIHHFHDKLLLIKDRLKTDMGRKMGEKRHQVMEQFLKDVDEEYACVA